MPNTDLPLIKGTIDSIAFGGAGLLKDNGLVTFVPFTAPGDVVEVAITKEKKKFREGVLKQILTPSPLRVEPRCPYFGTCGGCQLQHISYEAQLSTKRQSVVDSLLRIGKVSPEIFQNNFTIEGMEDPWGYRERIALHLIDGKLGYYSEDNTTLIEIEECPIFIKEKGSFFKELRHWTSLLDTNGRVDVLKDKEGKYLLYVRLDEITPKVEKAYRFSQGKLPLVSGLEIARLGKWGKDKVAADLVGLKVFYSPKVFIQNNASQSTKIYEEVTRRLHGSYAILDLYSGIGISSLLLAKQGSKVDAIETSKEAVDWAEINKTINNLPELRFFPTDVERALPNLLQKNAYDAVLINPPRQGIRPEVVKSLKESQIKKMIYISCMPSTLARDVKELSEGGYQLKFAKAYDMFPQTGHIETLLELELIDLEINTDQP